MRVVGWDTETALIRQGRIAPPMTCLTWQTAWRNADGSYLREGEPGLAHWTESGPHLSRWLANTEALLVGQNVAFDLAVICAEFSDLLPPVIDALDADRVTDTKIRQQLIDIKDGCYRGFLNEESKWVKLGYDLDSLTRRHCGRALKKDGFRLFYAFFRNVPKDRWVEHAKALQERARLSIIGQGDAEFEALAQGTSIKDRHELVNADPTECIRYPLEDARATLDVYLAQEEEAEFLGDQFRQTRNAFWKHLASAWGLRTNPLGVAKLALQTNKAIEEIEARLVSAGLVRPDGTRDTKAAKARMLQACGWHWDEGQGKYEPDGDESLPLRLTDAGEPSLDSDACQAVDDPVLKDYAEVTSLKAVGNKDVPALARATIYPIHTHFDLAETGRCTSSNPNVQNWRRLPGIRECFVPRPGKVFIQADYSGLELATLAQACIDLLGKSELAKAINEGLDPHTELASSILGISPEEGRARRKSKDAEFDNARQTAKVANFGFPGGLGAPKLVLFARKTYGVELGETDEKAVKRAKELKQQWLARWPEMQEYFNHVNALPYEMTNEGKRYTLEQLRSGRIRGGATYTAACNSFFQGLGADATGYAGWLLCKACYVDTTSPLYGCRLVNYVHDEFIAEADEARAAEAAEELSRIMVKGAQEWIPDVKLAAEPCIMRVWSKDAKTLRDEKGQLLAWAPKEAA
jgi:DNA polymerase-1